jgi:hypothetical protein
VSENIDSRDAVPVIARQPWLPWRSRSNIRDLHLDCFASLAMTLRGTEVKAFARRYYNPS